MYDLQIPLARPELQSESRNYWSLFLVHTKVAILTLYAYNHLLSIGDEINLVWLRRWNFGSTLYVITRYLTAAILIYWASIRGAFSFSYIWFTAEKKAFGPQDPTGPLACNETSCNFSFARDFIGEYYLGTHILFYIVAAVAVSAAGLYQIRAFIVYEKNKRILIFFCVLDFCVLVICLFEAVAIQWFRLKSDRVKIISWMFIPRYMLGKFIAGPTPYTPLALLPFLLIEAATYILVLRKAWTSRGTEWPTSFKILVWDNVIYFVLISIIYLLGICLVPVEIFSGLWLASRLANIHMIVLAVTLGIMAPNMLLRLKRQLSEDEEYIAVSSIGTFQAMEPPTLLDQSTETIELESFGEDASVGVDAHDVEQPESRRSDSGSIVSILI